MVDIAEVDAAAVIGAAGLAMAAAVDGIAASVDTAVVAAAILAVEPFARGKLAAQKTGIVQVPAGVEHSQQKRPVEVSQFCHTAQLPKQEVCALLHHYRLNEAPAVLRGSAAVGFRAKVDFQAVDAVAAVVEYCGSRGEQARQVRKNCGGAQLVADFELAETLHLPATTAHFAWRSWK